MPLRSREQPERPTDTQILDVAERLVQTRGYNAFSYADIANELELTKAALHYHFAGKAQLGEALIHRYADRFRTALDALDASGEGAASKLDGYVRLYADVFRDDRFCLCGMLAAEFPTLPPAMRDQVLGFFDVNETWLASVLAQGRDDGTFRFDGSPGELARTIIGGLEGAMLLARPYGDIARFEAAASHLVRDLVA